MAFFEKLGNIFRGEDDGYIEESEENFNSVEEEDTVETEEVKTAPNPGPKTTGVGSSAALEMKVVKPDRLDNMFTIGEHLMANRTVVINFEETGKETKLRILDFLGGVVFAIKGNIKKVSEVTYIVTPKNVDVTSDVTAAAEEPKARELF